MLVPTQSVVRKRHTSTVPKLESGFPPLGVFSSVKTSPAVYTSPTEKQVISFGLISLHPFQEEGNGKNFTFQEIISFELFLQKMAQAFFCSEEKNYLWFFQMKYFIHAS